MKIILLIVTCFISIIALGIFWPHDKVIRTPPNIRNCLSGLSSLEQSIIQCNLEGQVITEKAFDQQDTHCALEYYENVEYYFYGHYIFSRKIDLGYRSHLYLYDKSLGTSSNLVVFYCLNYGNRVPVCFMTDLNTQRAKVLERSDFELLFEKQKKLLEENGIECSLEEGIIE